MLCWRFPALYNSGSHLPFYMTNGRTLLARCHRPSTIFKLAMLMCRCLQVHGTLLHCTVAHKQPTSPVVNISGPPVSGRWSFRVIDWTVMIVDVLRLRAHRPGIRCQTQTVFMTELWVSAFSSVSWKLSFLSKCWRDVGYLAQIYESINRHFPYLHVFLYGRAWRRKIIWRVSILCAVYFLQTQKVRPEISVHSNAIRALASKRVESIAERIKTSRRYIYVACDLRGCEWWPLAVTSDDCRVARGTLQQHDNSVYVHIWSICTSADD